ncbi:hypothetical protein ACJMK2_015749 [Sinanodonta woodiana]|uniref:5' exonuclease Apollo n=1 Tax=Sinanodonta woodiana TaxID=1069815 RepID=A0ABD3USM0_SINWO
MNGCVIPHTPVAVDFWRIRDCPHARLFFLSHLHGDHIVGLTSSWQYPIYCTPITAEILKLRHNIRENLIRPLDLGVGHILYLDEEKMRTLTVTLINANHCPGACMFLFQGQFGNILYTGDFRYDKGVTESSPLCDIAGNLDIIYLDNTYCLPACSFPSRQKCFEQIVDIIRKFPDYDVVIGLRSLGKEDLLVKIALELQEWIAITPKMFELVNILNLPQVFAMNDSQCRIRVEPFHKISNKSVKAWNEKSPTIAILPTALYCGLNMSPFINQDKVFIVPYSDHSSYTELLHFVSYLRPCSIQPIVRANSRGPFGTSIANRADMTCFSKYLNKSVSVETTRTLENARTCMVSRPIGSLTQGQGGVKRKNSVKVSKSRIKKMGVIFEDSPVKLNMSEIMKESSVGKSSTPDMLEETLDCKNSFNMKTTCVKENILKIETVPQDTQNTASVSYKFTRHTLETNQIWNGNKGNESDQNIVSCCVEGKEHLKPEGVTSHSQSVDVYKHVNNYTLQENLTEEISKKAFCADSCAFQSSVDLSCESHKYPDFPKDSVMSCNLYRSSNQNLEALDTDRETNVFKNSLVDSSNYSFSSDSSDHVTEDSGQAGHQSEPALAGKIRFLIQSASESQKPQFSEFEIMDQVSPLQNSESEKQSKSKISYLTCEVKKISAKSVSDKINTSVFKSSTKDTTDVCVFNLKDTERINLNKVDDKRDCHVNKYDCDHLQKVSDIMTNSRHDVSDIHSVSPNDTNDRFQNFQSNAPNETSDKFHDFKSNKFDKSRADLPCDRGKTSQPADSISRPVECDSNQAGYTSEFTNMNGHCSCTETRCSQIKEVGTRFQTDGLKKSTTCQSQHKKVDIDLSLSLTSKEKTLQFTDPDLGSSFIKDPLDVDTNVSADDVDMNIIGLTSHPYTGVDAKKIIKAPRDSIKALNLGEKLRVLYQTTPDVQGQLSSASSTNDRNLKLTSLTSFCTKGGVCKNAANSDIRVTEKGIVKGDNEYNIQRKALDLCTKENQKDSYSIVFSNVSVKPLNKYTYKNGRECFYRNAN